MIIPKRGSEALAEEILASHFTLVAMPGAIDMIALDGADGWTSPNPHPALSLMRWTTDDPETAAAALDQLQQQFQEKGHGFDWMTGPHSAHLVPLLYARGFIDPPLHVAAMVRDIPADFDVPVPDGIEIRKVADRGDMRVSDVMSRGFDVADAVGAIFHNAYLTPSPRQTSDVYAAYLDGNDTPVGVGYLSYIGDGPSVLLRVSSTLEDYRARGIYRALVQRRLVAAARKGRTQAFVHAYSTESQRALLDLGFLCAGILQLHRWRP
jgi:hypothetical protein